MKKIGTVLSVTKLLGKMVWILPKLKMKQGITVKSFEKELKSKGLPSEMIKELSDEYKEIIDLKSMIG